MGLRQKVFAAFMAFIVAPLFVLGAITYLVSQYIIEDNFNEQSEFTIRAVGRNLVYVLKEANQFTETSMLRQDVQSELQKRERVDLFDLAEYGRLLQRTFLSYPPAYSVALYNLWGQGTSEGKIGFRRISFEDLTKHPVYGEVRRLNGLPRWIGPHELPELTGGQKLFTQIRIVNDLYTLDNKGVLIEQFQLNELHQIFNFFGAGERKDVRFMLVGRDGTVMVDNKEELEGTKLAGGVAALLGEEPDYVSRKLRFGGEESMVSVHRLDLQNLGEMQWTLVSVTPWRYLSGTTQVLLGWVAAITTLCLLSALLFNLLFVNRSIRVLLHVVQAMKRAERGDLSVRTRVKGEDETSVLARGFNRLVERIEELLLEVKREQDRKNKAELMLMQAQIKPHFLFNTLESINALAVQNQGTKVSRLVRQLGTILRISFDPREEIPLKLELDHLRSYMQIQQYRFENVFDYTIELPPELENCLVPKLTLQPLVENSIQYGFEGMERLGMITIRAEEENGMLVLWVEDNGLGMAPRDYERVKRRLAEGPGGAEAWYPSAGAAQPEGMTGAAGAEEQLLTATGAMAAGGRPASPVGRAEAEAAGARESEAYPVRELVPELVGRVRSGGGSGLGIPNVGDRLRIQYGGISGLTVWSQPGLGVRIRCLLPLRRPGDRS
ncbi:cache domain-containing sensor histidine kinase [Gorillibacterium sp. sgz5001074]|uniref:cache domain-containing sensor histidine kinase n=1 Tax=Gorillibacterium sp. sgz5001074 TaxID=3446695 RepID=UPI003F6759DC